MSKILLYLSTFFIAHASFSAYEHVSSTKRAVSLSSKALPADIVTELLVALLLFCFGTVLNARKTPLKLVSRSAWASTQPTRENDRIGFVDIVKRRREYALKHGKKLT